MKNVIKSFLFLVIGFALGAFSMKYMAEQDAESDSGFKPIPIEKSVNTPRNENGFTPIQKEQSNSGFKPIQSSPREQALLQENQQLKERIQYLEAQLRR